MLAEERLNETSPVHHGAPPEPPRRPYWPAALFVIGLLVALLGAAVLLNDRFRPRPTIEPAATGVVTTPITTPSAAGAAPSTPLTARPTDVPSPTAAAPTPTSSSAALGATVGPTAAASALTPLQREIAEAYLRHWNVVAQAQYDLDTSRLGEVMAGDELARSEEDIRSLRAAGHAARVRVELNYRIVEATPDEATVYDEYVNRSILLDAATKQPIANREPPPDVAKMSFKMRKIGGTWKVVDAFDLG